MPPATAENPPRAVSEVPTMVLPVANDPEMQMRGSQQDPTSIASISAKTQVLQGQSIADSVYDAPVPPARKAGAVSGFQNGNGVNNISDNLLMKICCLVIALLLITGICYFVGCGSSFNKMIHSISLFKFFRR